MCLLRALEGAVNHVPSLSDTFSCQQHYLQVKTPKSSPLTFFGTASVTVALLCAQGARMSCLLSLSTHTLQPCCALLLLSTYARPARLCQRQSKPRAAVAYMTRTGASRTIPLMPAACAERFIASWWRLRRSSFVNARTSFRDCFIR